MVTVLITSFFLLAVISYAIYRWQRVSTGKNPNQTLSSAQNFDGLFADSIAEEQLRLNAVQTGVESSANRKKLFARANDGDKSVLLEAHQSRDNELYSELLNALVLHAENEKQVLVLASYISRNGSLPVNLALAKAFTEIWKQTPDRGTTAKMLHIAALAGDAAYYQQAIELVLQDWREQRLQDISTEELVTLFESEFWLVPSNARSSGAGFLLKRKLAKIRRELVGRS